VETKLGGAAALPLARLSFNAGNLLRLPSSYIYVEGHVQCARLSITTI
jgi:hypothetical protein